MEDLTGMRFGKTLVLSYAGQDMMPCGRKSHNWNCLCDCGASHVKTGPSIKRRLGPCRKCAKRKQRTPKHGMSSNRNRHPMYSAWHHMKDRCYNPNCSYYHTYGAKGVIVEEPWRSDFTAFYADMGSSWERGLVIDRINTFGNYCKSNCRWVTPAQSMNNTRRTVWVRLDDGRVMTMADAHRVLGGTYPQVHWSLKNNRITYEEAASSNAL